MAIISGPGSFAVQDHLRTRTKLLCNMEGVRKTLAIFAAFLVFRPIPTSSTPSPGSISKNYAQIAQLFGLPFPKLPLISSANVGKQCKETVEKLSISELVLCGYFSNLFFATRDNKIRLAWILYSSFFSVFFANPLRCYFVRDGSTF